MTPLETLKEDFDMMESWEDRYAYIIGLGKGLAPYPEEHRTESYKVKGCQSQVWLYTENNNGRIAFFADSDAIIVRGLVALLLQIYNNQTPTEILNTPRTFIEDLGLSLIHISLETEHIVVAITTVSENSGFTVMPLLSIMPNPTHSEFQVQLESQNSTIRVISASGEVVSTCTLMNKQPGTYQNLSVHNLPSGVYIVSVYNEENGSLKVGRLVKL